MAGTSIDDLRLPFSQGELKPPIVEDSNTSMTQNPECYARIKCMSMRHYIIREVITAIHYDTPHGGKAIWLVFHESFS